MISSLAPVDVNALCFRVGLLLVHCRRCQLCILMRCLFLVPEYLKRTEICSGNLRSFCYICEERCFELRMLMLSSFFTQQKWVSYDGFFSSSLSCSLFSVQVLAGFGELDTDSWIPLQWSYWGSCSFMVYRVASSRLRAVRRIADMARTGSKNLRVVRMVQRGSFSTLEGANVLQLTSSRTSVPTLSLCPSKKCLEPSVSTPRSLRQCWRTGSTNKS